MKLAVATWYHYRNYGTALQAVALAYVLRNMGHASQMIRYKPCSYFRTLPDYRIGALSRRVFRKVAAIGTKTGTEPFCDDRKDLLFENFLNSNLQFTDVCTTKSDLELLNNQFDAFVCGSDQIWSPLVFNPRYYLDYVHTAEKKIAYAPSIGVERIEDRYVKTEIAKLLNQFGSVSVREKAGQQLIKELTGKDAQVVLDPTLLLAPHQWEAWFDLSCQNAQKPYLLVYLLGENEDYWHTAEKTAAYLGLELRVIPVFEKDLEKNECIQDPIGPLEFLRLIYGASYVCTDSYHGMIFAIQFHKRFTAFRRFRKGDARNQNSRILHLLSMVEMQNRLMRNGNWKSIADLTPDYPFSDRVLEEKREQSMRYLSDALQKASNAQKQRLCVKQQNSLCCGCGVCARICPVSAIRMEMNPSGFWEAEVDEEKCVHCGKCIQLCPFCTEVRNADAESALLYSFKSRSDDVLLQSTSGGAAFHISKLLLEKGYGVVGCRYNKHTHQAEHILIDNLTQLSELQGSKYIQSNFSNVLEKIQRSARPLVVFGTPCQIAAARRLFAERTDIVYIDLVCHGVPSDHLFRKYRDHIAKKSGLDTQQMLMNFRYKPKGWRDIYLQASDGKNEYCCDKNADPFFRMFEVGNCYHDTCYECRWRVDSEADIRLGDYWGPKYVSDQTGVSMVVCFTQTGKDILDMLIGAQSGVAEKQPISEYLTYQQSMNLPQPVFYDTLLGALCDEKTALSDLVDRYAVPLENRTMSRREHLKYVIKMMLSEKGEDDDP